MRRLMVIVLFAVSFVASAAEKFDRLEMQDGTVYDDVTVMKNSPAWIKVMHKAGVTKLMLSECSETIKLKYDYDEKKAGDFLKEEAADRKDDVKKDTARRRAIAVLELERVEKKKERNKEFLEFKRKEKIAKDEVIFLQKVKSKAVMLRVDASQKNDTGLLGNVEVGQKNWVTIGGVTTKKKLEWNYGQASEGIVSGTPHENTFEDIFWEGKGWDIGWTERITTRKEIRKVRHFTASLDEATAYYRSGMKTKE